jgi:hypothetical protein
MFPLRGRMIQPRPALVMFGLVPCFLAAIYLLSGQMMIFTALFSLGLTIWVLLLMARLLAIPKTDRTVVATRDGLQLWEGGDLPCAYDWSRLTEFHCAQVEFGRWRIAFWDHPKSSVQYSPFFFTWLVTPSGAPLVDLVLTGDEQTGQMICEELAARVGMSALPCATEVIPLQPE